MALVLRPATPDDHALFARFFLAFDLPDPIPDLAWWTRQCRHACFAEEDGKAVGYGLACKMEGRAYVMHCAVEASARGRGVGRAVMEALAKRLLDEGCTEWTLNVMEGNEPAIALYRGLGMVVAHKAVSLSIPWSCVDAMPRGTGVAEAFEPAEDRAVEDRFGIDAGRISLQRTFEGRTLLRLRRGRDVVGVISFDPAFPGTPLLRAPSLGDACTLFDAVRAHARHDYFRLLIEADDALADSLMTAGATLVRSLLHMVGTIPSGRI
jgi:GNAT superfamily N-acetyltransferase